MSDVEAEFHNEVIDRLVALNAARAAEEKRLGATVGAKQKGAGKGAATKAKGKKAAEGAQLGLLGDEGEEK